MLDVDGQVGHAFVDLEGGYDYWVCKWLRGPVGEIPMKVRQDDLGRRVGLRNGPWFLG